MVRARLQKRRTQKNRPSGRFFFQLMLTLTGLRPKPEQPSLPKQPTPQQQLHRSQQRSPTKQQQLHRSQHRQLPKQPTKRQQQRR
ncbi:hypothetical protein BURMUCF2_2069 [Burkholderia multivorans CF2]|nr:hypothetical protein BURMUCF2_2069 [Burkholderia multivorans CF2]